MRTKWQRARRQEQREERVTAILDAAAKLFERSDFDGVSMAAIGRQVRLAQASIYGYFDTKEALFLALCLREVEAWCSTAVAGLQQLQRPDAAGIAGCLTEALRAHRHILRLHAIASPVLERIAATDRGTAEFGRAFRLSLGRIVAAISEACPALAGGKAIAFMYQHQALASGLFTMAPGAAAADGDAALKFLDLDYFTLFERTLRHLLEALMDDPAADWPLARGDAAPRKNTRST
ncbi:MAG: TetR family transcriptional regulator [Pirellulales bacterium]|nr:TetR family transcriptional regulator [Pirellulales bacterium]